MQVRTAMVKLKFTPLAFTSSERHEMAEKRKRDHDDAGARSTNTTKQPRKAFSVGPRNLPDGTYRRKSKYLGLYVAKKAI